MFSIRPQGRARESVLCGRRTCGLGPCPPGWLVADARGPEAWRTHGLCPETGLAGPTPGPPRPAERRQLFLLSALRKVCVRRLHFHGGEL